MATSRNLIDLLASGLKVPTRTGDLTTVKDRLKIPREAVTPPPIPPFVSTPPPVPFRPTPFTTPTAIAPTPAQPQAPVAPAGTQVINLPIDSAVGFSQMLKDITRNILSGTPGTRNLLSAGQEAAGGLVGLPEELAATPGFAGLNLSQARRLVSIEEAGLTNLFQGISGALDARRSRLDELVTLAGTALTEETQRAKDLAVIKQQELTDALAREQQAITDSLAQAEKKFNREEGLRKEFTAAAGDFVKIRDSYGRILESAENPSAAGDIALVFNYMKMLDPASVVRESEFATAQNAPGVPDRIRGLWNRLLTGERFAPGARTDFVNTAKNLYDRQVQQHQKTIDQFTQLAERQGVDPANVILDLMLAGTTQLGGIQEESANVVIVKGIDGNYYQYDTSNPADAAELAEGKAAGFFIN